MVFWSLKPALRAFEVFREAAHLLATTRARGALPADPSSGRAVCGRALAGVDREDSGSIRTSGLRQARMCVLRPGEGN